MKIRNNKTGEAIDSAFIEHCDNGGIPCYLFLIGSKRVQLLVSDGWEEVKEDNKIISDN